LSMVLPRNNEGKAKVISRGRLVNCIDADSRALNWP